MLPHGRINYSLPLLNMAGVNFKRSAHLNVLDISVQLDLTWVDHVFDVSKKEVPKRIGF